ncbi:adhesion G protein-coupled receptor F5-like [Menidia menidia]
MALPKSVKLAVVLLVVCYTLEEQGFRQSLTTFFEEMMGTKTSTLHSREKRQIMSTTTTAIPNTTTPPPATPTEVKTTTSMQNTTTPSPEPLDPVTTNAVLELHIPLSGVPSDFIDQFRAFLSTFPQNISQSVKILDMNFTTGCRPNSTGGLKCQCEDAYAWSCDMCTIYGECSNTSSRTCNCINGLPNDGEFCQPISNVSLCPTPSPEITTLMTTLPNTTAVTSPPTTEITTLMTTLPNTTAVSSPPTTEITTLMTTLPNTTAVTSPPPTDPFETLFVLKLSIPVSVVPSNFTTVFRNILANFSLHDNQNVEIIDLNVTTVCNPNSNSSGGMQCQCEDAYAWSCDKCAIYGECSNTSRQTCNCINGLPNDGEFCQPISSVSLCPTPSPEITTLMTTLPNTTAVSSPPTTEITTLMTTLPNTTAVTSPPPTDPFETLLVLQLSIPVLVVPSNFTTVFMNILANFSLPDNQNVEIIDLNVTTVCNPNSNSSGGMQCQCEDAYAWSCDKCAIYGECSNTSRQTCNCINGLPNDGEFCQPISSVSLCPTPTAAMSTTMTTTTQSISTPSNTTIPTAETTPTSVTSTPVMTTTTNRTTPTITTKNTTTIPTAITPEPTQTTTPPVTTTEAPTTTTSTTTTTVTTTTANATTAATTATTAATTPTTPNTTTAGATTSTAVFRKIFNLVMDIEYQASYSNTNNALFKNVDNAIQSKCKEHIPNLQSVKILKIRAGSTIVDFEVIAPAINDGEIENVNTGLFTELSKTYTMVSNGPVLQFQPKNIFFGQSMTVTCDMKDTELSPMTAVEWRRDDKLIVNDAYHKIIDGDRKSTLTVDNFSPTDNGKYECRLKIGDGGSYFRQQGSFEAKAKPQITVKPVKRLVSCEDEPIKLTCSVDDQAYEVKFAEDGLVEDPSPNTFSYAIPDNCESNSEKKFTCQLVEDSSVQSIITLEFTKENFLCKNDPTFGDGILDFVASAPCEPKKVGEKTAKCLQSGTFGNRQDNCVLEEVQKLLDQSQNINEERLPKLLDQLSNVTVSESNAVTDSPTTITAIVTILENVANASSSLSISLDKILMEDVLLTVGILTSDNAIESWKSLNEDTTNKTVTKSTTPERKSRSSSLLKSIEDITTNLNNESFNIATDLILLNKTTFNDTFDEDFDSSVVVEITEADDKKKSITVITFSSMDNVLPPREEDNSLSNSINGRVALIQSSGEISNITITFDVINDTLGNPKCVFWNFSLLDGLGGWDDEGCSLAFFENDTVSCNCNHLTSFSILMSPFSDNDPALAYITYIGVGISMGSLVICLIIEGFIWRKIRRDPTSYLRHVSIVNIAVSLLIANIWFIIGAAISDKKPLNNGACTAATFFIHFFYLSLFFWMLATALLLLNRIVSVLDGGSKMVMLAIGFSLGYGAPLIIVTITIAVTAPEDEYIRNNEACWLNWDESKALLAFVIPALLIVVINLLILVIVIYKILRRRVVGNAAQAAEKHVLLVIVRCLAVLTPLFGLTWGLGVGTMTNPDKGIRYAFAFFNSLQGFFILVFGTLLDKKVRSELTIKSQTSQSRTTSTSAGFSFSNLRIFRNWQRGRGSSSSLNVSSSASESQSFTNA